MLDESILREGRLCVVGNLNRDIKTAPVVPGNYLFADGETSVAAIHETIGGGGANSAAIAASLGAEVSFIGQIGDDALGARLQRAMETTGARCCLHRAPELVTGTTVNLVFEGGQRHFLSCHPNNLALCFERLDLSAFAQARHLLRADIWFSDSMLFGGNERLLRAAKEAGLSSSLDLNWDPHWGRESLAEIERRKNAVRAILPLVDLVHGNIIELNEFAGSSELETSLHRLQEWGVRAVVVHMGGQGAGYYANGELIIERPAPVEHHLAATGTGDVLSACLMLMHDRTEIGPREKLCLANRIVAAFIEGRRSLIPKL